MPQRSLTPSRGETRALPVLIPDLRWPLIGGIRENTSQGPASTTVIVQRARGPGVRGTTVKIQAADATVGIPESVHRLNQQKQKKNNIMSFVITVVFNFFFTTDI